MEITNKTELKEKNKKYKGLSASCIKTIALICMFIDHFAASVVMRLMYLPNHPIMQQLAKWTTGTDATEMNQMMSGFSQQMWIDNLYQWMRNIGRISFPIYCFFIVEGFYKTRNRKKYARRLAACALLSEIPFDLAIYGKAFYLWHQNVFFTLLIGLLAIWAMDVLLHMQGIKKWGRILTAFCTGFGFALLAELLFADYNSFGVLTMIVMYVVRRFTEQKIKFWAPIVFTAGSAVLCIFSFTEVWAFLALPLMFFYQGKKGWNAKWFFYLFYPVHLLVLAVLALCFGVMKWKLF